MGRILSYIVKSKIIRRGIVEYSIYNAWNFNLSNGNLNYNNNKYNNQNRVRPVSALLHIINHGRYRGTIRGIL